ncbi:MAG: YicC/YloC family endoribonuclease [Thermoanaerobaculia bacterium]
MTVRSMTGFGRAHGTAGDWNVDVVVRSVNHRFFDLNLRVREEHAELEPVVRRVIASRVARGKIDVTLRLQRARDSRHEITINESLLQALLERFADLSGRYPIGGRIEVRDLLTVPQVVRVEGSPENLDPEEAEKIAAVVSRAIDELVTMRVSEGGLLAADLRERLEFLRQRLARISASRNDVLRRLHDSLKERLSLLFAEIPLESGRLEQEAVLLVDRSDISEEVTRLESHLGQFEALLGAGADPVGKKLDFLAQELQREINTIGSKCRDLLIMREVIDMKTETEKIREQVQNLE